MKHIIFDCDGTLVDTSSRVYRPFEGIVELLESLKGNTTCYVWTARDRASTMRILHDLKLINYFEEFCTCDDAAIKPNIEGLQKLIGHVDKKSVCVIGDSSADIFGGNLYGVLTLGAIWNGTSNESDLKEAGADFIVNHPKECSKLIEQNLMRI